MRTNAAVFAFSFLLLSSQLVFADADAETQEKINQCICYSSCWDAGWDCSVVSCYYEPDASKTADRSPDCADAGNGACVCAGFGCGRAPMNMSHQKSCAGQYGSSCASDEVEVDGSCMKESEACKGEKQEYDSGLKTCKCEIGYYLRDGECRMPSNRERKEGSQRLVFETLKGEFGQTLKRTCTFTARPDAVGDTVFYLANVHPPWLKQFISANPPNLYLKPGETAQVTLEIAANSEHFQAEEYINPTFLCFDDKYQYVDSCTVSIMLADPNIPPETSNAVQENTEIYNEAVGPPPMPTESTGSIFEDIKRVMRASAFGTEAAAEMESIVDMYASDPEGDKNLLTALAAVGLFPEDKIQYVASAYAKGTTTLGEVAKSVAEDYLDSQKEEAMKKMVDVTGLLTDVDKGKVYENLAKVLPQMLKYKYYVESNQQKLLEEIRFQNRRSDPLYNGDDE